MYSNKKHLNFAINKILLFKIYFKKKIAFLEMINPLLKPKMKIYLINRE